MLARTLLRPNIHPGNRDPLRFIATLNSVQRQRAFTPEGLPLSAMVAGQRTDFLKLLRVDPATLPNPAPEGALHLERRSDSKQQSIVINLSGPGDRRRPALVWLTPLPESSGQAVPPSR